MVVCAVILSRAKSKHPAYLGCCVQQVCILTGQLSLSGSCCLLRLCRLRPQQAVLSALGRQLLRNGCGLVASCLQLAALLCKLALSSACDMGISGLCLACTERQHFWPMISKQHGFGLPQIAQSGPQKELPCTALLVAGGSAAATIVISHTTGSGSLLAQKQLVCHLLKASLASASSAATLQLC